MSYETSRSEAAYKLAQQVIAGGVNSGARGPDAGWLPSPPVVARGEGAELWDVDGNRYVDHLLALGPMIHGHAHPEMTAAVTAAIADGTMYALPFELEAEAAQAVIDAVPSVELVRFSNSGTEAVLHATRIARAASGRSLVVRFEGQYHGWADQLEWSHHPDLTQAGPSMRPTALPGSLGIPQAFGAGLVVMPWNDVEAIEALMAERGGEIAAILTEPIMGNTGVIPPNPGYLETLRRLTTQHGSLLIFDEVITGFRVGLGGAQGIYGVTPDLTTMAKALGGGFPVSVVGGRRDLLELVADGSVLHAGTYNASTLAVAAVKASLGILSRPGTYERLYAISARLQEGIGRLLTDAGVAVQVQGVGPMFQVWFSETPVTNYREAAAHLNSPRYATLVRALLERGVMVHPSNIELWFVSTAHTDEHVDRVLNAFEDAVKATASELRAS
ncbi:MAG: glutamate-1-semialdehyde 2,1-aminomutase [Actinobacteria bacterium]|nr:glutamate-1-semialdehyde 2,1-aminomutase [Actinomycetota bacterium]